MTPGVEWRNLAIISVTLKPGSWPPSPGLAPWATLISISRHLLRYSAVTPKRPEATCLIAELALSPLGVGLIALRVLAALAGIRLGADPVHGDVERAVRLGAERAQRHARRDEALADRGDRFDLLDRHRSMSSVLKSSRSRSEDGGSSLTPPR